MNGQVFGDVQVSHEGVVVVARTGKRVYSRRDNDGINAGGEVRLHDGSAQRAAGVGCLTDAICRVSIRQVVRAVDIIYVVVGVRDQRNRVKDKREDKRNAPFRLRAK
ncbi:MAG: hypothetical protein DLM73_10810 [Chthoniobacterales bacterium]|nr:MAG: hypothetical protein DLM73_10810 [Chthoniobacterales bacterium]